VAGQSDPGNHPAGELVTFTSPTATTRPRSLVRTGFLSLAVAGGILVALVMVAGGRGQGAGVGGVASSESPVPSGLTEVGGERESPSVPATPEPDATADVPEVDASPSIAAAALPADLVAAFEAEGRHLTPLAPGAATPDANALRAAVELARAEFGPNGTAAAFPAMLTVDGYHVGDENSPLAIEDRSVIAVQITGLSMPPFGGRPGDPPVPKSEYSTELVVFVDAATGEFLLASSVR